MSPLFVSALCQRHC